MAGGGKGGKQTDTKEIPLSLETGAQSALASAMQAASLDFSPNRGVTIAGFSPQQEAAFAGANMAASAFGMPTGDGQYLPEAQTTADGYKGYSTGGLYDEMRAQSMSASDVAKRNAILSQYAKDAKTIRAIKPGTTASSPNSPAASGGK